MRTVVADDDGDEWSIEILDGDCTDCNALAKPVKQTQPTSSIGIDSTSTSKGAPRGPFLNDFSTKVMGGIQSTTAQETTKRASDILLPPELTEGSHHASHSAFAILDAKETRLNVPHLPTHIREPNKVPPESYHREHVQFQVKHQSAKLHPQIQPTKDVPPSSSRSKANEEESSLPVYSFLEYKRAPAVVYTKSESEANDLVQTLKGPLGFDLEWRVMWHPGAQERRTALVQLCDHQMILLIQVSSMQRFPKKVLEVIESADTVKTGANILNDGEKLFRDFGIQAKGLVELGAFATKADVNFRSIYNREIVSLAKMVAMYIGKTLLKGKVRTSNWEADLSHKMVEYAANDCHCALMVYDRLEEIATQAGKALDASMYSCQVNPRSSKPHNASVSALPQSLNGPTKAPVPNYCIPEPPRPQQLRAYKLWHVDKMPLDQMCMKLRTGTRVEPLKESTVISYVVGALQADPRLPFNIGELKALVFMEAGSWQRHRQWIASRE